MVLQHVLAGTEHVFDFMGALDDKISDTTPESPCIGVGLALGCTTNFVKFVKNVMNSVAYVVSYAILTATTISFQVVDDVFEIATLGAHHWNHILTFQLKKNKPNHFFPTGPDQAIYGYYYSRANYLNIKGYSDENRKALVVINDNMKKQHTDMKVIQRICALKYVNFRCISIYCVT